MPEGPEIKRAADALESQIAGRLINRLYFGLAPLKSWEERLKGARVTGVKTYGKAIVTQLDNGLNIYSHNQLYGRWMFCDSDNYPDTHRQLRIALDCEGKSALLYSASSIEVLTDEEVLEHRFIRKLGPDVLGDSITAQQIVQRLTSDKFWKRQLGSILTDQSFLAGLGNYLRCEILFIVRLHPRVRSADLHDETLHKLARTILELTKQSYQTGGITRDLETVEESMGDGANFEDSRFYVFRRAALPCYVCGTCIEKIKHGSQACYVCPDCQIGGVAVAR